MKLRHVVSLSLGLKGVKIAQNGVKLGVHGYLSNEHLNLWSNLNSQKLVRSETPSFIFARVGLEGVQIARTIAKVGVHAIFISNGHPNLWSNFNSESLVKSETSSFNFAKVGVTRGENRSKCCESWSAQLPIKRASKSIIKFQFWEICQKWNSAMHFH